MLAHLPPWLHLRPSTSVLSPYYLLSVSPEPEEGLLLPSPNWYHFWSSLLVCLPCA